MNHFLAQQGNQIEGILSKEDSHHALRVLRLGLGDDISVSYGDGDVYLAEITTESKSGLGFKIKAHRKKQTRPTVSLAIAPTKSNDRFEIALEKSTELGVRKFFPIICAHSERKVYKRERGQRIIQAAFKQSHKGYLPEIDDCESFNRFINNLDPFPKKYIAALVNNHAAISISSLDLTEESLVLIGPEGDFSEQELEIALKAGFQPLSLGKEVLRTETAAILVAALSNAQLDFKSREKS